MPTLLTSKEWLRLQQIFDAAIELAGDERSAYLDRACADTPGLRQRVDSLIASFEGETRMDGVLSAAATEILDGALPAVGGSLGAYRITGILGRGGMGVVYRATRADAEYEMEVAIKVARLSTLTGEFRERFLRERQILADLVHPHIARLLDGGTTNDELPYVVMEYVAGKPIDVFCTDESLDLRARIRLMVKVARAVGYAHQHLVVHRDLKPDNIHVTAEGEPKLLDFGIAKAMDLEARGAISAQTIDGSRLMTADYASPEQVRGEPITTATDVYQLGVLLYLLLTGSRPFQSAASLGELERAICESAVPKSKLDGDLNRILLHAMEKDPAHRYASAKELADDLERYLDGYPIHAHSPSWTYLTAKFVVRHRLGVATAALFVLLLAGFAVGMTFFAGRASQQARIAGQTTNFLIGLFEANDPSQGRGDKITARELLDKGAAHLNDSTGQDPTVQVHLLDSMGTIYNALGASEKAREMLERSLKLRLDRLPREDVAEADTLARLAAVETDLSHYDEAIRISQRALASYRSRFGDRSGGSDERIAALLAQISSDYWELDNMAQAETYERQALTLSARLVGRHDRRTLDMIGDLGTIIDLEGKGLEAQPYYDEYLNAEQALKPQDLTAVGQGWNYEGWLHYRLGRFTDAEQEMRNALGLRIQAYGDKHPTTAGAQASLAYILLNRGKAPEALALATLAKQTDQATYGLTHRETAYAEDSLGLALLANGRTGEARQQFQSALDARLVLLPPLHMQTGKTWMFLAMADLAAGNLPSAAEESRRAVEIMERVYGPHGHPQLAEFDAVLLEVLTAQRKLPEAEEFGTNSVARFRQILSPGNPRLAGVESALGWALYHDGRFDPAIGLLREALAIDKQAYGPNLEQTAQVGVRLAACIAASGQQQQARELVRRYQYAIMTSSNGVYRQERAWLISHRSMTRPA